MKFSASSLKNWMECQLQAKFNYLDGHPQPQGSAGYFGSAVHEALEAFNKGKSKEEAIQIFKDYMHNNEPDYWNRMTSFTGYMDTGEKMIENYVDSRKWATSDIIASEFRFMVPFGEHQLSGIVDSLEVEHNDAFLRIVDYKTGKRPIQDALYLNIQFTIYDYATHQKEFWCGNPADPEKYTGFENGEEMYEHYKSLERRGYWHDMKKNELLYVGPRSMRDYARLYRVAEQVARAVEHEVFVPTINESTCTWCPYQDICPVYFEEHE